MLNIVLVVKEIKKSKGRDYELMIFKDFFRESLLVRVCLFLVSIKKFCNSLSIYL